jgi:hypothetical protein
MGLFNKIFGNTKPNFSEADNCLNKLNSILNDKILPSQKKETKLNEGTASKEYFDIYNKMLNDLPDGLQANSRHLIILALVLRPSLYKDDIHKAVKTFVEKTNFQLNATGKVLHIDDRYVRLYEYFDFDNKQRLLYNNISFDDSYKTRLKEFTKDDELSMLVKLPEDLKYINIRDEAFQKAYGDKFRDNLAKSVISAEIQNGITAWDLESELIEINK